jgi:hypothetical protein
VCLRGITAPLGNFQLSVIYDDTVISAPEIPLSDGALDDNPDANAGATTWGEGLGENWTCDELSLGQQPIGDGDPETGPGHGRADIVCWSLFGPWTLGDNEDAGVLAVISFNAAPYQSGATSLELAEVQLGSSEAMDLGSCNPAAGMAAAVIDCVGATVRLAGPTIAPEQWPTPTPVAGVIARPTLGPGMTPPPLTVTPIVGGGSPEAATKTAEAAKNTTKTPEAGKKTPQPTKSPPSSPGGETDGGGTDWLWPTVIGIAAVMVVAGVLALAVYLWRRGQAR